MKESRMVKIIGLAKGEGLIRHRDLDAYRHPKGMSAPPL